MGRSAMRGRGRVNPSALGRGAFVRQGKMTPGAPCGEAKPRAPAAALMAWHTSEAHETSGSDVPLSPTGPAPGPPAKPCGITSGAESPPRIPQPDSVRSDRRAPAHIAAGYGNQTGERSAPVVPAVAAATRTNLRGVLPMPMSPGEALIHKTVPLGLWTPSAPPPPPLPLRDVHSAHSGPRCAKAVIRFRIGLRSSIPTLPQSLQCPRLQSDCFWACGTPVTLTHSSLTSSGPGCVFIGSRRVGPPMDAFARAVGRCRRVPPDRTGPGRPAGGQCERQFCARGSPTEMGMGSGLQRQSGSKNRLRTAALRPSFQNLAFNDGPPHP